MRAVHFGAGNIGRGFIGQLLNQAGYQITFLDVNADLVEELKNTDSYEVIETGANPKRHKISDFTALNSSTEFDAAADAIANSDIVTASVGVNVLRFVAPVLAAGLELRVSQKPLVVMACENAIGATDILRAELEQLDAKVELAIFANTAVDRIVPPQKTTTGLDVVVESFSEWVIEATPFAGKLPPIPSAKFVQDLIPFIERKLFTVNTGHASLAYLGQRAGLTSIVQAASNPDVMNTVRGALNETSEVLIHRHGFDVQEHEAYVDKTIERFGNPELDDPVERVGRQPARKLERNDRIIGPAAYLAELGKEPVNLLNVVEAALSFVDESDPDVAKLLEKRRALSAGDFVREVMGISPDHPLAHSLTNRIAHLK